MKSPETPRPVERPVTRAVLKAAAKAGYHHEVHTSIHFVDPPLTLAEGAELVTTGMRIEALNLQREAEILQNLAGLSDDPRWQEKFTTRADELRSQANAKYSEVIKRKKAVQDLSSV